MTTTLFARDVTAAKMLDMKPAEFRRLVEEGALPRPVSLDRWDVEELKSIMRGEAAKFGRLEL
jgi:predicted DNA-binding transcriptional regulator AlpA